MQNIKCIDYQRIAQCVVQMWFRPFGINFHVAGTKME